MDELKAGELRGDEEFDCRCCFKAFEFLFSVRGEVRVARGLSSLAWEAAGFSVEELTSLASGATTGIGFSAAAGFGELEAAAKLNSPLVSKVNTCPSPGKLCDEEYRPNEFLLGLGT